MARITITIEDIPGNKVSIVMTPSFESLMKMNLAGSEMKSSHGYALCAINAIRRESKKIGPTKISIPRLIS